MRTVAAGAGRPTVVSTSNRDGRGAATRRRPDPAVEPLRPALAGSTGQHDAPLSPSRGGPRGERQLSGRAA